MNVSSAGNAVPGSSSGAQAQKPANGNATPPAQSSADESFGSIGSTPASLFQSLGGGQSGGGTTQPPNSGDLMSMMGSYLQSAMQSMGKNLPA